MNKTENTAVKTENTAKTAPVVVLKTVLEPEKKPAEKPEAKAATAKAEKSAAEKPETKAAPSKAEKSTAGKPETKAAQIMAEESAAEKPEIKAAPAKTQKSTAGKPETKAAQIMAEESAAEKPETKAAPAKAEESSAEKSETKAAPVKAEKPAEKPEVKFEAPKAEKSSAPKQEAKPEPAKMEKPAPKAKPKAVLAKPEAKTESPAQATKPESSALEKAAVPNPPAVSEKPAIQVVDSPLKRMKQEFTERSNVIKQEMRNIQNSFLVIGFQLHWIKENNMYKVLDYKSISEFAEKEFGIKKSTCSNFIQIIENYAERDEHGEVIESIAECYRNFTSSQLVAMLGMPEEMQQQVTPDMSVRAINRLRKGEPEQPPVDAPKAVISNAAPVPVQEAPKPAVPMPVQEAQRPAAPAPVQGSPKPAVHVPVQEAPRPVAPAPVQEAPKPVAPVPVHETPKPAEQTVNSGSKPLGNPGNPEPRTLLEIKSYSGYRSMVDKIDGLVKDVFKTGKQIKVKIICEEG